MSSKQLVPVLIGSVLFATACGAEDPSPAEASPQIFAEVPADIDPGARYLVYLHGAIIETEGATRGSGSTSTRRFSPPSPSGGSL